MSERRRLFIESNVDADTIQKLLVLGGLIAEAQNFDIVIGERPNTPDQTSSFANLYLKEFQIIREKGKTKSLELSSLVVALFKRITLLNSRRRLLNLKVNGILVGPIIYDTYLGNYTKGSVDIYDLRLVKTIFQIVRQVRVASVTLKRANPDALLLSHRIGLTGGIYALLAALEGIPVFNFGGDTKISLDRSLDPHAYLYRPNINDLIWFRNLSEHSLSAHFENAKNAHLGYELARDTERAFGGQEVKTKSELFELLGVKDCENPIVFILAHVPNDYPNALGASDLYSDYHDWLVRTLEIIESIDSVTWIVKEHPSMANYSFDNKYFDDLETRFASRNVHFLRHSDNFSAKSLRHLASAVITCKGSAGFELPALYGIPTIYWTGAFYSFFKVGTEISNWAEFASLLNSFNNFTLGNLPLDIREAKSCYIFVYLQSRLDLNLNPPSTQSDLLSNQVAERMKVIHDYYLANFELIEKQKAMFVRQLSRENFQAIRQIE